MTGLRRVKIKKKRPSPLAWALAFMLLMLAIYLATNGWHDKIELLPQTSNTANITNVTQPPSKNDARLTSNIIAPALSAYAIQFGSYTVKASADKEAQAYILRGAAGYVINDTTYRVVGSVYYDKNAAQAVKDQLKSAQGIDSYIYAMETKGVEMRVTAKANQITALENGFKVLLETAKWHGELAISLDKREIDADAIKIAVEKQLAIVRSAHDALKDSVGETGNAVSNGLIDRYKSIMLAMENITAQKWSSTLELSSKIKYNHVDIVWNYIQYISGLISSSMS